MNTRKTNGTRESGIKGKKWTTRYGINRSRDSSWSKRVIDSLSFDEKVEASYVLDSLINKGAVIDRDKISPRVNRLERMVRIAYPNSAEMVFKDINKRIVVENMNRYRSDKSSIKLYEELMGKKPAQSENSDLVRVVSFKEKMK